MKKLIAVTNISKLIVFGGTHGNERPGIDTVNVLRNTEKENAFISPILNNERAITQNVRYIDEDLNRSFSESNIKSDKQNNELIVARNVLKNIGFDPTSFVIDLHTTTSKSGSMLILMDTKQDSYLFGLSAYIKSQSENVNIVYFPGDCSMYMTPNLSDKCMGVELGPVPHGTSDEKAVSKMVAIVKDAERYIKSKNEGHELNKDKKVNYYKYADSVFFPQNESGTIVLHGSFIGRDYVPLMKGDKIFKNMITGEDIVYDGNEGLCPIFINEQAYTSNNSGVAFHLTEKATHIFK